MKNINELELMNKRRKNTTGYMVNKIDVKINIDELMDITVAGAYDNRRFDKYMKISIKEKEKELIKRAFELEELEYQKIKKLAKIEAIEILTGGDLCDLMKEYISS